MKNKLIIYGSFFVLLLAGFYYFIFKDTDFSQSKLPVINDIIQPFSFVNQNGKTVTERDVAGKVYVVEYFFTTCKGICPIMNANMRRVYDEFKEDSNFVILSHTCMPEVDSVNVLKQYETFMLNGTLQKKEDGRYKIVANESGKVEANNKNWYFLTGNKSSLYDIARHSYLIDDPRRDTASAISDQFMHTQFFALVDKQRRVRGIYDGLKEPEIEKLFTDIKDLLKEKALPKESFNKF